MEREVCAAWLWVILAECAIPSFQGVASSEYSAWHHLWPLQPVSRHVPFAVKFNLKLITKKKKIFFNIYLLQLLVLFALFVIGPLFLDCKAVVCTVDQEDLSALTLVVSQHQEQLLFNSWQLLKRKKC